MPLRLYMFCLISHHIYLQLHTLLQNYNIVLFINYICIYINFIFIVVLIKDFFPV